MFNNITRQTRTAANFTPKSRYDKTKGIINNLFDVALKPDEDSDSDLVSDNNTTPAIQRAQQGNKLRRAMDDKIFRQKYPWYDEIRSIISNILNVISDKLLNSQGANALGSGIFHIKDRVTVYNKISKSASSALTDMFNEIVDHISQLDFSNTNFNDDEIETKNFIIYDRKLSAKVTYHQFPVELQSSETSTSSFTHSYAVEVVIYDQDDQKAGKYRIIEKIKFKNNETLRLAAEHLELLDRTNSREKYAMRELLCTAAEFALLNPTSYSNFALAVKRRQQRDYREDQYDSKETVQLAYYLYHHYNHIDHSLVNRYNQHEQFINALACIYSNNITRETDVVLGIDSNANTQ